MLRTRSTRHCHWPRLWPQRGGRQPWPCGLPRPDRSAAFRCDGLRPARALLIHFVVGNEGTERLRLFDDGLARGRGFFHQRGVLLRGLVHLNHGLVDLFDSARLLTRSRGDLGDDVRHLFDRRYDFAKRAAGFVDELAAFVHLRDAVLNERLDFFRGCRRATREVANFSRPPPRNRDPARRRVQLPLRR